jgi:4-carboxymuconolactone decarboxylase
MENERMANIESRDDNGSRHGATPVVKAAARRDAGIEILRHVIGEQYFAKRRDSTNGFNADIRRLSEEYCFGEVWSRPGLEPKFRSLLCIGMLVALNHGNELRLHVNGAINNGCTVEEIKEVLLQATIYCGLPSGVDGVRIAEDVLRERGLELGNAG